MLHRRYGAGAGEGNAQGDFERHFFVGRPLAAAAQFGEALEDFCRRGAGITRAQGDSCVQGGQRNGFVAAEELSCWGCHEWIAVVPVSMPPGGRSLKAIIWQSLTGNWRESDSSENQIHTFCELSEFLSVNTVSKSWTNCSAILTSESRCRW